MLRRTPTEAECDKETKEIRSEIHGRLRQEMRMSMDLMRETIKKMKAMAKWRYVLKSVDFPVDV